MASTIILKNGTSSAIPSTLAHGEPAINVDTGLFYYGSGSVGAVKTFSNFTNITASISSSLGGNISASGYVLGTNIIATGNVSASGNIVATGFISSSGRIQTLSHITASGNISASGTITTQITHCQTSVKTPLIEFTDGDDAIAITDGGITTFTHAINKRALHFLYTANKFTLDTSTETYFSLSDADRDSATGSEDTVGVMTIIPLDGVLRHVIINCSSNLSNRTWVFRLYRVPSGANSQSGGEILIASVAANAGPTAETNKKISFIANTADTNVLSFESGYNATTMFTAGDRILLSLESNSDAAGNPKINSVLCLDLDESTI